MVRLGLEPGESDVRCKRIHWAMMAPQTIKLFAALVLGDVLSIQWWRFTTDHNFRSEDCHHCDQNRQNFATLAKNKVFGHFKKIY